MAEALFPSVSGRPGRCAFTETRLKIGQRLEFQLTPAALNPRRYTHLIGYEPGQSVLVATPRPPGAMAWPSPRLARAIG